MSGLNCSFGSFLRVACAIAAIVGTVSSASAEGDDLKAVLQARYDVMREAMTTHDDAALKGILARDFTSIDILGKSESAAQMLSEVKSLKVDPNRVSSTQIVSLSESGDHVMIEQRYEMMKPVFDADGSAHQFSMSALSTDTWIQSDGTWLLVQTDTHEISVFRDGKLVVHKTKP